MRSNAYDPRDWTYLIPDLERVLQEMDQEPIMAVGVTPYTRIIPSFFLEQYSVYTINRSSDVDALESYVRLHVLEDHQPKLASRVHSTSYLLNSPAFQNFLRSRKRIPRVMLNTITDKQQAALAPLGAQAIGNAPETFADVALKGSFRDLARALGLPVLPSVTLARDVFLSDSYERLFDALEGAFVVQRADKEVGGNEGTFFVKSEEDFNRCVHALAQDATFSSVIVTAYVEGYSTSMLGCAMKQGVLSGPLQLQLIDIPESLHGVAPNGIFFGNDISFVDWEESIEQAAQEAVERIGAHMGANGYRGIFGIDFLYDRKRNALYANECNPRFTGSLVLYSLMLLERKVPPLEFFHLLAQLNIESSFDFKTVNAALKSRLPCAHVAVSPKGIHAMELPLVAGVYSYDVANRNLSYQGPGTTLADLKEDHQFLLIDTVPKKGTVLGQEVPRLFKFIFRRGIARSSRELEPDAGFIVERFAAALKRASGAN